jgi:hypothetical protein
MPNEVNAALLISGTVGVGKSSVADAVGRRLRDSGTHPGAVIDLDRLCDVWPAPPNDPFSERLMLANLRSVAGNARLAGHRWLVVAGVVETGDHRARMEEAVGSPLSVCRLVADQHLVRERLTARHVDDPDGLTWHLRRVAELDAILDAGAVADAVVDVTRLDRDDAAAAVLTAVGWA